MTIRPIRLTTVFVLFAVLVPARSAAQNDERDKRTLRPMRIAKWGTLAGAAAGAIYGFVQNHRADDLFNDLERLCQDQPVRCSLRDAGGAYRDPEFEALYGDVRHLDRRAHTALLLSQIGVATSVVLFLLDLDNTRPPDIPFVPSSSLEHRPDGGVALVLSIPWR